MARYKHYDNKQTKMILLHLADQIQPGTFEYTLNHVVDNDLDLSVFESRYRNDVNGAPAYDQAILLKVVLFAYSRGFISSHKIAQACRENVIFMALSADSQSHYNTIADFIFRMDEAEDRKPDEMAYLQPALGYESLCSEIWNALSRLTLRIQPKVNALWMMYCMVHNFEKLVTQGAGINRTKSSERWL